MKKELVEYGVGVGMVVAIIGLVILFWWSVLEMKLFWLIAVIAVVVAVIISAGIHLSTVKKIILVWVEILANVAMIFLFSIVGLRGSGADQLIIQKLIIWLVIGGNLYGLCHCLRLLAMIHEQELVVAINTWLAETKERLEVWRENHAFDLLRELAGDEAQGRISSVEFAELLLKRFPSRARLMRVAKINKGFALALIDTRLLLEDAVQQIDLLLAEKNIMIMREKLALMKPLKLEY